MNPIKIIISLAILLCSFGKINAQNAKLHVDGSFATTVTTTTVNLTLDDSHQIVLVNSPEQRTITLPSAVDKKGRQYTIKKIGSGTVNVQPSNGEKIDNNNGSYLIFGDLAFLSFVSDGSNWWIIGA